MKNRRHHIRRQTGFTLIETLLAIAITIVVLGIVYSAYLSLQSVNRGVDARDRGPVAAMNAVNQISRDLMCGLRLDTDPDSFLLEEVTPTDPDSAFSFYTAVPGDDPYAPLTWYTIERVSYYVDIESEKRQLTRESSPIVGSNMNMIVTNVLLDHVGAFSLAVFSNEEWTREWGATAEELWPKAARISLQLEQDERVYETDVFLPVGNTITSTLERATTPVDPVGS